MPRLGPLFQIVALDNPEWVPLRRRDIAAIEVQRDQRPLEDVIHPALDFAETPEAGLEVVGPDPLARLDLADGPLAPLGRNEGPRWEAVDYFAWSLAVIDDIQTFIGFDHTRLGLHRVVGLRLEPSEILRGPFLGLECKRARPEFDGIHPDKIECRRPCRADGFDNRLHGTGRCLRYVIAMKIAVDVGVHAEVRVELRLIPLLLHRPVLIDVIAEIHNIDDLLGRPISLVVEEVAGGFQIIRRAAIG